MCPETPMQMDIVVAPTVIPHRPCIPERLPKPEHLVRIEEMGSP